ncbi:16S rRNA (adenine(1518)-N(6)/adenine(1519)-N(6))-dimethyltransferase RsmA [Fuchsiella alkaliacetigena]|uniref:16S rRNA (adenine(1518)-N(6)/adenine(1519)-N(6))- dimethyltransferase RsmA n=1 Tax=Fuchsiella alkaliacetigena TaxID=957042 RepID=UPI00200A2A0A|nr:16S rRNA (adenine(1518)-N(6)/adenine(1519)-N(6))-dimethyltransferase RsmA [Fuchsiella alkaliacetigena]MCK8824997.1 16S rRNA (adenine(1518)-N(6)/adenine(1519)-N(6))-dimethyltransferase RsmA [Fuchsiella alkaliacetigena]
MESRIANPSTTKKILNKHGIRLKKSLGQNFLVDRNIIEKIVQEAEVGEEDYVIEIGAGIGSLTQRLVEEAAQVWALELDQRMIKILTENLNHHSNLEFIQADALEYDFKSLLDGLADRKVKVVANLPYYITTPLIMKLLENRLDLDRLVVMVQKEVAQRMVASPADGKQYGAFSLAVQYYSEPTLSSLVPNTVFIPQPEVESAIVNMRVREEVAVEVEDEELLFALIKASFQQRRKTIRNSLSKAANIDLSRDLVDRALSEADISRQKRGEKLSLEQFAELSNIVFKLL